MVTSQRSQLSLYTYTYRQFNKYEFWVRHLRMYIINHTNEHKKRWRRHQNFLRALWFSFERGLIRKCSWIRTRHLFHVRRSQISITLVYLITHYLIIINRALWTKQFLVFLYFYKRGIKEILTWRLIHVEINLFARVKCGNMTLTPFNNIVLTESNIFLDSSPSDKPSINHCYT